MINLPPSPVWYTRLFTPDAPLLGLTVCMWTKPSAQRGWAHRYFYSIASKTDDNFFSLGASEDEVDNTGAGQEKMTRCTVDILGTYDTSIPCRIMDGGWHHYCAIYDGTRVSSIRVNLQIS